jgi:histone H3/H4
MRDTPRDDLRALSRALAPKSKPIVSSSPQTGRSKKRVSRAASFLEDGSPAPDPPRLSLGRREMADDDDSFHAAPPRMSVPLDDYDVEGSRREYRRDRESFANLRLSDLHEVGADIIEETEDEMEEDDIDYPAMDDDFSRLEPGDNETTRNLRALMNAERPDSDDGGTRQSYGGTDGEPTFQFNIAERSGLSIRPDEDAIMGAQEDDELPIFGQDDDIQLYSEGDEGVIAHQFETERGRIVPNSSPGVDEPEEVSIHPLSEPKSIKTKKALRRSKHGIEYPSLPPAVVKKLAATFSKAYGGTGKINKETLDALTNASDWFFENASDDLAAYADHAHRKTIEDADVITLMKR